MKKDKKINSKMLPIFTSSFLICMYVTTSMAFASGFLEAGKNLGTMAMENMMWIGFVIVAYLALKVFSQSRNVASTFFTALGGAAIVVLVTNFENLKNMGEAFVSLLNKG